MKFHVLIPSILMLIFNGPVFGITFQQGAGNVKYAVGCDFNGGDFANQLSTGEQCGGICESNSQCTHFTWTNWQGGTCWLKSGPVSESSVTVDNNNGAVCGYVTGRGSGGMSGSGTTTRYWDCCKPSCSWNGKGPVTSPVHTCAKDGKTGVGVNDPSGCGGGNAFVCSNQIPWLPQGSDVAYGFAAANVQGRPETDVCCSCFELTFTSGPINGKKIVVQVTNSGGDLGSNHFDLQIPGGGVGIFNGCKPQWGAPDDGWGQRFGGVSSSGDCAQLPADIRNGCYWRFGWFQNADNPSMNFRQVSCPSDLTAITGCSRTS